MPRSKTRRKKSPKRILALPDLEHAKAAVLNSLTSTSGQRTYDHAIREFVGSFVGRRTIQLGFQAPTLGRQHRRYHPAAY